MSKPTSVRFDDTINEMLAEYTASHDISKSEFIKEVVQDKLEDWNEIKEADEAYKAWRDDNSKTYSFEDALKKMDVQL